MSVHGPLSRRVGSWSASLEVVPIIYTDVTSAAIVANGSAISINQTLTANLVHGGSYGLSSYGTVQEPNGVDVELPKLALAAFTGPQARPTLPALTLEATGTVPSIGRVAADLPALSLVATGRVGSVSAAQIILPDAFVIRAFSGAQFRGLLRDRYSVSSNGLVGQVGGAQLLHRGFYVINASGSTGGVATAILTLPALSMVPSASANLTIEPLWAYATGYASSATYEAYAVNLANGAVTRYTNFPFHNIVRLKDRHFLVSDTGMFELSGSVDKVDNNTQYNIESTVKFFAVDIGSVLRKRVWLAYFSGRIENGAYITVQADEGTEYTYSMPTLDPYVSMVHRVPIGKGINGMYYTFTFQNMNSGKMELDRLEVITDITTRGI